jgi:hypothetical protein
MLIPSIRSMTHNCLEYAKYARHEIYLYLVESMRGMIVFSPISMKRKTKMGKEVSHYCLVADGGGGGAIYNYSRPHFIGN